MKYNEISPEIRTVLSKASQISDSNNSVEQKRDGRAIIEKR